MGTLLLPLRVSVYHWRRDILRSRKQDGHVAVGTAQVTQESTPAFSPEFQPIFCDASLSVEAPVDLESAFAEADAQLRGVYRFAGGRCSQFDSDTVEMCRDVEDVHAYHRLYWARRCAVAASFGHEGAQQALLGELPQWLDGRWENSAIASWPYTRAERIASLTMALFWIHRSAVPGLSSLVVPIKQQIWKDAVQLSSNVEFALGLHNHLLNNARGLFLAATALAPECEQAAEWREQAFDIWDKYFPQLVLEDGTFAEQSSHYHLLLCRTALEYSLACRRAGRAMPAGFEGRIRSMFDLANELLRADGSLPRFGDNSPDCAISDLWGLLAAAYYYGLLANPPRHRLITPLTLFYCGTAPEIPKPAPPVDRRLFCKGGFAILRSPALDAELVAHGDGRDGVGAHGDTGRGSYEFWWDGHVLVREPGSFFSSSDANWRAYQCADAQNVTSLDGLSPAITKQDEGFVARWYRAEGGTWEALADGGVQFRCEAFKRLRSDITLFRAWRFTDPGTLTLEERIEGSSRVQFESRICLGDAPWGPVEKPVDGDAPLLGRLRWHWGDGASAEMTITAPANLAIADRPCTFLPEYGVEKQGRSLLLSGFQQLPFSWTVQWKLRKAA
ncbi:MAG: heparinase II/III family protein [Candidatus Acidiferrales bacterium]